MSAADRYLWTLPMFHANGWTFTWIVTAVGGRHVCLRKVEPAAVFRLHRAGAGHVPLRGADRAHRPGERPGRRRKAGVPAGVRVLTAGAPPAAATIERIEGELGWEVTQVYGLTETSPFITICEPLPEHAALSRAGRARQIKARQGVELLTSGEVRVVGRGGRRGAGRRRDTLGEIVVRGNVVMAGYYNDPEATAAAMGDGWFHSGDAAVVHPDGYIEIRDRLKDVIISGGENISSVEVEATLLRHRGRARSGGRRLRRTRSGAKRRTPSSCSAPAARRRRRSSAPSAASIWRTSRCRTASRRSSELPKTATGKIQKFVLRGGKRPSPGNSRHLTV